LPTCLALRLLRTPVQCGRSRGDPVPIPGGQRLDPTPDVVQTYGRSEISAIGRISELLHRAATFY
jgi:hypothetical protein